MADDRDRWTRRRSIAAVVVLAVGVVIAIAAPIVGGDRFLPLSLANWRWIRFTTASGGPPTTLTINDVTVLPQSTRWFSVTAVPSDFVGLVTSDPRWIAAAAALVSVPLWFWWWRRSAMSFARGIGVLASAAATSALVALTWPAAAFCAAHVLVAAAVAYLAAFLVAPSPRVPDAD